MLLEEGKRWKRYIVALAGSSITNLALYYYKSPVDKVPVGEIPLHSAHIDVLEVSCISQLQL